MNIAILTAMLQYWGNRTPDLTVKILDRNVLLGKCTPAIFSVILDPPPSTFFSLPRVNIDSE